MFVGPFFLGEKLVNSISNSKGWSELQRYCDTIVFEVTFLISSGLKPVRGHKQTCAKKKNLSQRRNIEQLWEHEHMKRSETARKCCSQILHELIFMISEGFWHLSECMATQRHDNFSEGHPLRPSCDVTRCRPAMSFSCCSAEFLSSPSLHHPNRVWSGAAAAHIVLSLASITSCIVFILLVHVAWRRCVIRLSNSRSFNTSLTSL